MGQLIKSISSIIQPVYQHVYHLSNAALVYYLSTYYLSFAIVSLGFSSRSQTSTVPSAGSQLWKAAEVPSPSFQPQLCGVKMLCENSHNISEFIFFDVPVLKELMYLFQW